MQKPQRKQVALALAKFYEKPVARVSLELFMTVGAVVFFALFAIQPTLVTMSNLVKEIEDKRGLDAQLGKKVASLATAQAEYYALNGRDVVLNEAVPVSVHLVELLQIVEKLASEQEIAINRIGLNQVPDELKEIPAASFLERQALPMTIVVQGDYPSIRQFVESLRQTRRMFVIQGVTFSIQEKRGAEKLQASISVEVPFYGKKPEPSAGAKKPAAKPVTKTEES